MCKERKIGSETGRIVTETSRKRGRRLWGEADNEMSDELMAATCVADGDDMVMDAAAYERFTGDYSWGSPCDLSPPLSVRFVHKFDPGPSIAYGEGLWAHTLDNVMVLSDEIGFACNDRVGEMCELSAGTVKTGSGYGYEDYGLGGTDPYLVEEFLCTKVSTSTISIPVDCVQDVTSYMSLMNPNPCNWILTMRWWQEHPTVLPETISYVDWSYEEEGEGNLDFFGMSRDVYVNAIDTGSLMYTLFVPFETYQECLSSWYSTFSSHYPLALVAMPETLGMMWSFTMTHISYGLYPLCTNVVDGVIQPILPPDTTVDYDVYSCTSEEEFGCTDYCDEFSEPGCFSCCMNNGCTPCSRGSGGGYALGSGGGIYG
jgi:hypothetical protein